MTPRKQAYMKVNNVSNEFWSPTQHLTVDLETHNFTT